MPPARRWWHAPAPWQRLDLTSPRALYVMRSILAAWLALVVAYWLQLDMPFSAATTVLLVINPLQGAVIGKGVWRVLGTLVGMVAAIALMGAFAQMPWLFLLGFGAWLGGCVAIMTLLRHFRASGAVVAGYTVGLATFGAIQHPSMTFETVIGRGSTVLIGVMCLSLVTALLSRRSVRAKLDAVLGKLATGVAQNIAGQHTAAAQGARSADSAKHALMAELYAIDDLLAAGKAESADLAHRAADVRHAMASLFSALIGTTRAPSVDEARSGRDASSAAALGHDWEAAAACVARGPDGFDGATQMLRSARMRLQAGPVPVAADTATERCLEQIDDYLAALDALRAVHAPRPAAARQGRRTVHFHRDTRAALRNGLAAMITLVLAGAFWFVTGWPHGDMMLLILAPYCSLLATAPNPAPGAFAFLKGSIVAVPVAFVCAFGVLPHLEGMPLLCLTLAIFWAPGIYATSQPQTTLAGLAYLVGFNTLTGATNPMHFDGSQFLNWSVAWVVGSAVAWLGFRLVLPRHVPRDIERLRRRIRDEALAVLCGANVDARVWQYRQQHRLAQLGAMLKTRPAEMDAALGEALHSVHAAREQLRHRSRDAAMNPTQSTGRSHAP